AGSCGRRGSGRDVRFRRRAWLVFPGGWRRESSKHVRLASVRLAGGVDLVGARRRMSGSPLSRAERRRNNDVDQASFWDWNIGGGTGGGATLTRRFRADHDFSTSWPPLWRPSTSFDVANHVF